MIYYGGAYIYMLNMVQSCNGQRSLKILNPDGHSAHHQNNRNDCFLNVSCAITNIS